MSWAVRNMSFPTRRLGLQEAGASGTKAIWMRPRTTALSLRNRLPVRYGPPGLGPKNVRVVVGMPNISVLTVLCPMILIMIDYDLAQHSVEIKQGKVFFENT